VPLAVGVCASSRRQETPVTCSWKPVFVPYRTLLCQETWANPVALVLHSLDRCDRMTVHGDSRFIQ
jgi:hypothetical protein